MGEGWVPKTNVQSVHIYIYIVLCIHIYIYIYGICIYIYLSLGEGGRAGGGVPCSFKDDRI